jgi:hypothetical protein
VRRKPFKRLQKLPATGDTEGPPQLLRSTVSANTSKRLIKARWEKEGQRRSVIIPAGHDATTTIECNWLRNVNHREQGLEQTFTI